MMKVTKRVSFHGFQQFYVSVLFSARISAGLFSGSRILEKRGDFCRQPDFLLLWSQRASFLCCSDAFVGGGQLHGGALYAWVQEKAGKDPLSGSRDAVERRQPVRVQISGFRDPECESAAARSGVQSRTAQRASGIADRYQFLHLSDQFLSD